MSERIKELKAVQQEIKDLIKKKTELKNRKEDGQLNAKERNELEGIAELLTKLEGEEKFWQGLVEKESPAKVTKPKVAFSKASLNDCTRNDGLNLDVDYIRLDVPTLHIPENISPLLPSEWLSDTLEKIQQLLGFCEVKNDWEGSGVGYTGDVDYMLGTSKIRSVESMDSFLLVVEAKKEWPDSAIPQVLCEAGCLLKKRLAANKNTPVFAVLTNGIFFRFFAIDVDAVVYCSELEVLKPGQDGTYTSSTSLSQVLRWFTLFMASIKSRASGEDLTQANIEVSLSALKTCFGPKNTNLSKKIKAK